MTSAVIDADHVTYENYRQVRRELEKVVELGITELDWSRVKSMDSPGISLVLSMIRLAKSKGQLLRCTHLPPSFYDLVSLYGIEPAIQGYVDAWPDQLSK